jgi:hypothetical protein
MTRLFALQGQFVRDFTINFLTVLQRLQRDPIFPRTKYFLDNEFHFFSYQNLEIVFLTSFEMKEFFQRKFSRLKLMLVADNPIEGNHDLHWLTSQTKLNFKLNTHFSSLRQQSLSLISFLPPLFFAELFLRVSLLFTHFIQQSIFVGFLRMLSYIDCLIRRT